MSAYPDNLQRTALYLRKSRADIEAEVRGEGETLSKHRRALMALAKKHSYGIEDVYEEIVSGERILDRPEMQKLLHAVNGRKYTAILCMDLDRLGRGNMVDQGLIQEAFKTSKTLIITPRKVYDLQDEHDEEWSEFEAFMARRELKIITRRMQNGRKQSASEGKSVSKKPPYGYQRGEDLRLFPDPDTAPVVQLIFRLASEGKGVNAIQTDLHHLGIASPSGNQEWEKSGVYAILHNPAYLGHIVWGKYENQKSTDTRSKRTRVRRPADQLIIKKDAHEALVDSETYERYQSHLGKRPRVSAKKELGNPFAGIIFCAVCGKSMQRQPRRPADTTNRKTRLFCRTPKCPNKATVFDLVEERIYDVLREQLERTKHIVSGQTASSDKMNMLIDKRIELLERDLITSSGQRSKLHDLLERGIYDTDTFLERNRILGDQIEQTTVEIEVLRKQLDQSKNESQRMNIKDARKVWSQLQRSKIIEERNRLLKQIIERVVYSRKEGHGKVDEFSLDIFLRL